MSTDFEHAAIQMIPSLVKVIHSGNKILAEVGHQVIKGCIQHSPSGRILEALLSELHKTRSGAVHYKLATYLFQVVCWQSD